MNATGNGNPKKPDLSIFFLTQVALAPSAGSGVISALPLKSTAAHSDGDAHVTASVACCRRCPIDNPRVPPVVVVNALPLPSTAMHNTVEGHETT